MKDDDHELIKQALAGNKAAFETLVDRHYETMYRLAYRWSGNRTDAEDITHNAFLKLADNLRHFKFRSSFKTWLYRLVINAAHDWHRSNARHVKRSVELHDNIPDKQKIGDPIDALVIAAAIQKLSKREREAMLLVAGEEMTHKEAAAVLGCGESTVSWHIHEARKKLYVLLGRTNPHG